MENMLDDQQPSPNRPLRWIKTELFFSASNHPEKELSPLLRDSSAQAQEYRVN